MEVLTEAYMIVVVVDVVVVLDSGCSIYHRHGDNISNQ